jgi:hypothetical protein
MGKKGKSTPAAAAPTTTYVQAAPTTPIDRTETNPNALERTENAANPALLAPEDEQKKYQSSMLG